ncbi:glycosyltransferase [Algivirga pacifica]|uniref:Glycosyltransferase family 4 protein n=1 Tax=Algivirga pacifica TaxID=1162670 RepID=A0ABP9DJ62_9BACT
MNILHINTADQGGGAEQFALDMLKQSSGKDALFVKKKKGNVPGVFLLKRTFLSKLLEGVDSVLKKFFNHTLFTDLGVLYPVHGTYQFLKNTPQYQEADIIFLHNIHSDYFDLDALVAIGREKEVVWVLHDMWVVTGGEVYTLDSEQYKTGDAKTLYKHLFACQNPLVDRRQKYMERKKEVFQEVQEKLTFIPVSNWLKDCLLSAYTIPDRAKIHVIQNGIDTNVFRNKKHRDWEIPRILFFNSSNPYKGAELFSSLAAQIEGSFELFVIGAPVEGVEKQQVFDPIRDRDALNDFYNQVDIMVFPSIAENFSLMVLEAMAAGVLVVGNHIGGIVEQLSDDRGVTFQGREDLKHQLEELLQRPLEDIRRQATEASEYVQQHWSEEKMREAYLKLLS